MNARTGNGAQCSPRSIGPGWIFVVAAAAALLAACGWERAVTTLSGATMGTQYNVTLVGLSVAPDDMQADIERMLAAINASMSTYDASSELSRLNANPSTDWIPVSPALHDVLAAAMAVGRDSAGAFDVTVGPLVNLWGFGPTRGDTVPADDAIAAARARVGLDKITLAASPPALRKARGDVEIDLSGIAKGYAVDEIARWLDARGYADYLVDIGGELRARGLNRHGERWRLGIEAPTADGVTVVRTISLTGTALASSGNYRNYFDRDGVRYGHTIDPASGRPVHNPLVAVTVLHDSAMIADAWATALMSMGYERALAAADTHALAALLFRAAPDGVVSHATAPFEARTAAGSATQTK